MKTFLTLFFLATLTTTATAAPLSSVGVTVKSYFNGELCGSFDQTKTEYLHGGSVLQTGRIGALTIEVGGELTGKGADERTQQCEATVELSYPKGYRFYIHSSHIAGHFWTGQGVNLESELDIRAGMGQYQRFHHFVEGSRDEKTFSVFFGNSFIGELRSDCSGSAELVVTNSATFRPKDLRGPGEIDDVGMAFIDSSTLNLEWERCAPGEL